MPTAAMDKADAQREMLVAALAAGQAYADAGRAAGVSERTVRRRMADPLFAAEVAQRRGAHVAAVTGLLISAADRAVHVLVDGLSADKMSDRLRAADLLLSTVRRFHADSDIEARLVALEGATAPIEDGPDE